MVKFRGEIGGEMYAAKLPAAKNAGFFNNVPLIDTPRSSIPKIVEVLRWRRLMNRTKEFWRDYRFFRDVFSAFVFPWPARE